MNELEDAIAALQRRVEALEDENAALRQGVARPAETGRTSRRHVLAAGVGAVGALAGGALLARPAPAAAETAAPAGVPAAAAPTILSMTVTLAPLTTRRAVWVDHVWELGAHFKGATPPVVVASAYDDHMEHDVTTACSCAAVVRGTPGQYRVVLMVRHISRSAQSVVINAVALGH